MGENNQMKKCPYCGEYIRYMAKKCRFCGEWLDEEHRKLHQTPTETPSIKNTKTESNEQEDVTRQTVNKNPKTERKKSQNGLIASRKFIGCFGIFLGATILIALLGAIASNDSNDNLTTNYEDTTSNIIGEDSIAGDTSAAYDILHDEKMSY